jgi:hypothetical protein
MTEHLSRASLASAFGRALFSGFLGAREFRSCRVLVCCSDDRIAKHQVVCAKAATRKPRRPFPSSEEMRLRGTDFMEYKDSRTDVSTRRSATVVATKHA